MTNSCIKISAAALNQTPFDWENNLKNILAAIETAKQSSAVLLALPELCISGYGCEDFFLADWVYEKSWEVLEKIIPHTQNITVNVGLPFKFEQQRYNVMALISEGQLLGLVPKKHLAQSGVYYEARWFVAWPWQKKSQFVYQGKAIPFGDLIFDLHFGKLAFEICEEAWRPKRDLSYYKNAGVEYLINPSASHFAFGKFEERKKLVLEASQKYGFHYIYSNLQGNESGRLIFDGGCLIASEGKLLGQGVRFSFKEVEILTADLATSNTQNKISSWENSNHLKNEEFFRAVSLGLLDYLRKSGLRSFVISLSGGVDSAVCAILSCYAFSLAKSQLSEDKFFEKFSSLKKIQTVQDWVFCAYQKTAQNSLVTEKAAHELAKVLGAGFFNWTIDDGVEFYQQLLQNQLGINLNWKEHGLALQNIQARVRGPGIWMLANLKNALLLSTSNRSEAAVGYTTMDGDTCGCISPIAGVSKTFLRQWLKWFEVQGPEDFEALPVLKLINYQAPTAELKPLSEAQTDEGDLMPYVVLDALEDLAIKQKLSPQNCYEHLKQEFPSIDVQTLLKYTQRFFDLWCKSQWKRERYALSFHLDDESVDPKTWCRFPVLSSGFREELEELK